MFQSRTKPQIGLIKGGLVLFFYLLIVSNCFAGWGSSEVTIRGYCTDNKTGRAVNNAQVKLSSVSNTLIASITTNSNGYYSLEKQIPSGNYVLNCSVAGYETAAKSVYLRSSSSYSINFILKKQAQNNPPKITSLIPKDKSTFFSGDNITILVSAADPDRDPLQYRYFLDGKVIKDWTGSSTYSFKTTAQDLNKHLLKVEVKDAKGATDAKTITICVYLSFPKPASQ